MERSQSADLIFNPATDRLRLMLVKQEPGSSARSWNRTAVPRKQPASPSGRLESSHIWTSWHLGDGHFHTAEVGPMPAHTASGAADTRWTNRILLPPLVTTITLALPATPVVLFEQGGSIYVGGGTELDKINPATDTVTTTIDLTSDGTTPGTYPLAVATDSTRFDTKQYVSRGFSAPALSIDSAGTVAHATAAGGRGTTDVNWGYLAVIRDKLYFQHTDNTIRSVSSGADPFVSGNFSGAITAGTTDPITSLTGQGRALIIGRVDGPKGLDQDLNLADLLPEISEFRHADNCKQMIPWHGGVLIPTVRGLMFWADGLNVPVGPERVKTNETRLRGRITALAPDGEWVYAALWDGANSYILAGRERSPSEPADEPVLWFQLAGPLANNNVNVMLVSAATAVPRLWFGNGADVSYITLSEDGGPPKGTHKYATTGSKDLPRIDGGQPLVDKYWRSVEIDVDDATATETVTVAWTTDEFSLFSSSAEGTMTTITASGRTEIAFPEGTASRHMTLRVSLARGDATSATPVIRRIAVNFIERPAKLRVITALCRLGPHVTDRNGHVVHTNPNTALSTLFGYEQNRLQQVLIDTTGGTSNVVVLEVNDTEAGNYNARYPEMNVTVVMEVVPDT